MKSLSSKTKSTRAKVHVVLTLAVITIGASLPNGAFSRAEPPSGDGNEHPSGNPNGCARRGDLGDCEKQVGTNNYFCTSGAWFNDCN